MTESESPVAPLSFHSDRIEESQPRHDELIGLLDKQADMPAIRRIRQWAHDALAVRPGERALDIGAGTGSEVAVFAAAAGPRGDAVGVDPNPATLAIARRRTTAAGSSARFVEGSAYALPFDDDTVDAVRCERVYQHLDHPEQASAEIARVLRPGGRVVLIDSDWGTSITHPGDPEVLAAFEKFMSTNTPNRHSGRRLRGLLVAAGLVIDDIGSDTLLWDPDLVAPMRRMMSERALAAGAITETQAEKWVADLENGVATGDFHFSVTMFAVLAHKP